MRERTQGRRQGRGGKGTGRAGHASSSEGERGVAVVVAVCRHDRVDLQGGESHALVRLKGKMLRLVVSGWKMASGWEGMRCTREGAAAHDTRSATTHDQQPTLSGLKAENQRASGVYEFRTSGRMGSVLGCGVSDLGSRV